MIKGGLKFNVDCSSLPKKNGKIDWKNSIGLTINFDSTQQDLYGELIIRDYNSPKVTLKYKNEILSPIGTQSLLKNGLGKILNHYI